MVVLEHILSLILCCMRSQFNSAHTNSWNNALKGISKFVIFVIKPVSGISIQEHKHSITNHKIIVAIQKDTGRLHTF